MLDPLEDMLNELRGMNIILSEDLALMLIDQPSLLYDVSNINEILKKENFETQKIFGHIIIDDSVEWMKVSILQGMVSEIIRAAQKKKACKRSSTIQ